MRGHSTTARRVWWRSLILWLAMAGTGLAEVPVRALIRDVDQLLEWKDRLHSEQVDWDTQRAALEQERVLLEQEQDLLQQRIAEQAESTDGETEEAVARERKRVAQDRALQAALRLIEDQAVRWRGAETVFPDAFPARPGPRLTDQLSALFAATLDVQQQQRSVRLETRVLTPDGAGARQFEVLYLGHAQAYAVSRNDDAAGHGVWTGSEWAWTWDRAWAPALREAVRIHRGERAPAWVTLPVALMEDAP